VDNNNQKKKIMQEGLGHTKENTFSIWSVWSKNVPKCSISMSWFLSVDAKFVPNVA